MCDSPPDRVHTNGKEEGEGRHGGKKEGWWERRGEADALRHTQEDQSSSAERVTAEVRATI